MTRAVAYPNSAPLPPPYTLSGPCITTKNRTILNMSDINHRRRKLFNIVGGGGGIPTEANINTLGGGGVLQNVHTRMHAHTHV